MRELINDAFLELFLGFRRKDGADLVAVLISHHIAFRESTPGGIDSCDSISFRQGLPPDLFSNRRRCIWNNVPLILCVKELMDNCLQRGIKETAVFGGYQVVEQTRVLSHLIQCGRGDGVIHDQAPICEGVQIEADDTGGFVICGFGSWGNAFGRKGAFWGRLSPVIHQRPGLRHGSNNGLSHCLPSFGKTREAAGVGHQSSEPGVVGDIHLDNRVAIRPLVKLSMPWAVLRDCGLDVARRGHLTSSPAS